MEDDYNFEYENDPERYEAVRSFFYSLDKENIVFENGEILFIVCEYIVCKRFGSREENERLYHANLMDFAALMYSAQPWFTPPERNDVPLEFVNED